MQYGGNAQKKVAQNHPRILPVWLLIPAWSLMKRLQWS